MNHRIFERKLRSLDIQGACLSECRDKNYTPLVWHVGFAFASSWTRRWTKLVPRSAWTWMCCCACALGRLNLLLSFPMRYHASRYITVGDLDAFHFSVERSVKFWFWPQIRQDYPLNLSILISGGKETNKDSPSNGEWSGKSSNLKSPLRATANCSLEKRFQDGYLVLKLPGTAHQGGWQSRLWHWILFTMRFLWVGLLGNAAQNGW